MLELSMMIWYKLRLIEISRCITCFCVWKVNINHTCCCHGQPMDLECEGLTHVAWSSWENKYWQLVYISRGTHHTLVLAHPNILMEHMNLNRPLCIAKNVYYTIKLKIYSTSTPSTFPLLVIHINRVLNLTTCWSLLNGHYIVIKWPWRWAL